MKRFSLYLLCCMVVGLASYCLADTSMTLTELDSYKSACTDSCCDTNGGSDCSGSGSSSCPTTSSPSGFGVACASSSHTYAPGGSANDADCESENGSTCFYQDPDFCTYYKDCDCETTYQLHISGNFFYDCKTLNCTDDEENPNNSKKDCTAPDTDDCTPW